MCHDSELSECIVVIDPADDRVKADPVSDIGFFHKPSQHPNFTILSLSVSKLPMYSLWAKILSGSKIDLSTF